MTKEIYLKSDSDETLMLRCYKKGKSIIFENSSEDPYQTRVVFELTKEQYSNFYHQLYEMAKDVWQNLELQDVTGLSNDYGEYYDRELDNNGDASIGENRISFWPPAPHLESNRLYRFTKTKIQTYLFDLKKHSGIGGE